MNTKAIDMKSINTSKDKFMEEMRAVVEDAEALLNATTNQVGDGANTARARIEKSLHVMKGRLIDAEEAVAHQAKLAAKVTDQYVHDNPWKAIGISACAGVIVGMLIARR
jgi:ElaB/YqjD/DUF883 family membrane-anchored ribosome-binding protein